MTNTTRLQKLLNKEFIYKQENIRIVDFYPEKDKETFKIILANKKPITVKDGEVDKFCKDLLPVDAPETGVSIQVAESTNGMIVNLQQTLLENIERVKQDPGYIKQASTINSSVNALVGMAKLQIQMSKMKMGGGKI